MTFADTSELLDRLDVRINGDSYDEGRTESYDDPINESFDDPHLDHDHESYDDDSAEIFSFLPNPFKVISQGINTVGKIIGGAGRPPQHIQLQGVRPNLPNTGGIPAFSNLQGRLTNASGRSIPFKLPANVATKSDIALLKKAIDSHNQELKKVSAAITKNAQETAKIAREVNAVDSKHTKATQAQNKVLQTMGSQVSRAAKQVNRLNKELRDTRQQAQMFALLPMFMNQQPVLEKITFSDNTEKEIKNVTYKEDDDNMMMIVMMMMMGGGFGSSSSGGGGMDGMMLPLMMIAMNSGKNTK